MYIHACTPSNPSLYACVCVYDVEYACVWMEQTTVASVLEYICYNSLPAHAHMAHINMARRTFHQPVASVGTGTTADYSRLQQTTVGRVRPVLGGCLLYSTVQHR